MNVESWNSIVDTLRAKELKESVRAISDFDIERKQKKLKTLKSSLADLM